MNRSTYWLSHMPFVKSCQQELEQLALWWESVNLVGKINSDKISESLMQDLETTRQSYLELQTRLIDQLVQEKLAETTGELSDKAQVAIDILVRNLFERTADVGFLSSDASIRLFLSSPKSSVDVDLIRPHLLEYIAKYSVYDDVILLDTQGRVRLHLNADYLPPEISHDSIIQQALNGQLDYIEICRPCDLQPQKGRAHLFATRITETDHPDSKVLGVLCLSFQLENEMGQIFRELVQANELLAFLDETGRVILSNDARRLPVGSLRSHSNKSSIDVDSVNQQQYVFCTRFTKGYQGYKGLRWSAYVAKPLAGAFDSLGDDPLEPAGRDASIASTQNDNLKIISLKARRITHDLNLVALNGEVNALRNEANVFIPILNQIRSIGQQTHDAFARSINSLQETMSRSVQDAAQFQAFLAISLMDRNLYERANDVRWWALTEAFRKIQAKKEITDSERDQLCVKLQAINALYSVYTNILLFDNDGEILAVSNPDTHQWIGQKVPDEVPRAAVEKLTSSQSYCVSGFVETRLYGHCPTYLYCTAIRAPSSDRVVGGIVTVFDSGPEFTKMLEDALPRDDQGVIKPGTFGLVVEPEGKIVASTSEKLILGMRIDIDSAFLSLKAGERFVASVTLNQTPYIVGAAASAGYREFKVCDGYQNNLVALVFLPANSA